MLVGDTVVEQVATVSALQQHPIHYDNTCTILQAETICSCLHIICSLLKENIVTNDSGPQIKSVESGRARSYCSCVRIYPFICKSKSVELDWSCKKEWIVKEKSVKYVITIRRVVN
jgi:hypothetical protein